MKQIGIEIPKVDVLEKALGEAKYGADLPSGEPLHLKVLRSPKPHAKIVRIEMDEALRAPGVERVFTAKDIPGKNLVGTISKDQPILASDRVKYIGDPVALVAAKTEEALEEAAKKLVVVYEDLPSITHPEEALQPYAPLIHEKGNLLLEFHVIKGDVQRGFKEADVVVEETYTTTWVDHAYLEPDAGISYLDEEGRITVVCPTQNVHYDQKEVASALSLPLDQVRIIQCATGGGFGGRLDITVQCLLALAVYHLRKPVRIVYSREEVFQVISKRHPLKIRYKSGAKKDGTLTAVEVDILGDTGAYASYGATVAIRSAVHATGPYQIPNVKVRSRMASLLFLALGAYVRAEVGTPIPTAPQRWLTDTAGLLSAQAAAALDGRLQAYEQSGRHQLIVYIGKTTAGVPIEDWAERAFRAWKVGRQGLDDGLVLFIMAEDRRVRIEVGYGLEGLVPDALAGRIINDVLVPGLQKGDPDGAVTQAVERLIAVISGSGESGGRETAEPKAALKLNWMQKIIIGIMILGFLLLLITNPSLAIYLLFSILSGGRGGGGGGGFSGGGGRSGGGGASGSW